MDTFKLKGNGVSLVNKIAIYVSFGTLVLFDILGVNNLLLVIVSVFLFIASVRAFRNYKKSFKTICISHTEISCFKQPQKKPDLILQKDNFHLQEDTRKIIISKIKGGDEYTIRKKDWDKEILQSITSFGIPVSDIQNTEIGTVDKVDNSLSIIYLFKKVLRALID